MKEITLGITGTCSNNRGYSGAVLTPTDLKTSSRSKIGSLLVLLIFGLAMFMPAIINAQDPSLRGVAPVNNPTGGFGIDGELYANWPLTPTIFADSGDWIYDEGVHSGTGRGVLNISGTPIDPLVTRHSIDLTGNADLDGFTEGSKFNMSPEDWEIEAHSNPGKDDMQNVMIHFDYDANGDLWFIMAGDRMETNGTSYLDFELFQKTVALDGAGGYTSEGTDGGRTLGDLVITLEYSQGGGRPQIFVYRWESVGFKLGVEQFDYVEYTTFPPNTVYAASNIEGPISVPYGAFGSTTYAQYAFAEAAVNLFEIIPNIDRCKSIATVLIKTKASDALNAALKDVVEPIQIEVNPNPTPDVANVSACVGNGATFSTTEVAGEEYEWFVSTNAGVSYTAIVPAETDHELILTDITASMNGYRYKVVAKVTLTTCSGEDFGILTVNPNPTIDDEEICLSVDGSAGSVTLNYSGTPAGTTPFVSDDISVATVTASGVVTAVGAGTADITYTDENGCQAVATITVNANPTIDDEEICLSVDGSAGSVTLNYSGTPAGTTPFVSDDISIATVTASGVVTAVGAGTADITYTDENGCQAVATITVNANPTIDDEEICLSVDGSAGSVTLNYSGTPAGTTPFVSDDISVATVTASGVVTAVGAGTADITYTDENGCQAVATITVNANPTIDDEEICLSVDGSAGSVTLNYSGTPAGTTPFVSDDISVATVTASGVVTAVGAGTADITYTDENGCQAVATITVNANPTIDDEEICLSVDGSAGSVTLNYSGTPAGTTPFVSDDISVATVTASGVVTAVGAGIADITYTDENGCQAVATVTVNANPEIPEIETQLADCIGGDGSAALTYDDPEITQFYYRYKDANDAEAVFGSWTLYTGVISLQPGSYTFEVKYTEDGCISDEFTVNINKPQDTIVTLTPDVTQPDCATFLGTIEISNAAALGNLNYTVYNQANPTVALTNYDYVKYPTGGFTGLGVGTYLITAVSDNGCEFGSVEVTLVEPQCVECETAFGKDDDGAAICFEDVPDADTLIPNETRWGWTNLYSFGGGVGEDVNTLNLYQGAAHCEDGTFVGTVTLTRTGNTLSVEFEASANYYFGSIHLYVGGEPFMYKKQGKNYTYTVAPGQYNQNPSSLPSEYVTEYTINGIVLTGDYYVIAHVDACTSEYSNINEDNISSAIAGIYEPKPRFATMLPAIDDGKTVSTTSSLSETSEPLFSIAPVPFRDVLNIGYLFDYTSDVTIQVFDLNGRLLATYNDTAVNSESISTFSVDFRTKAGQIYIVRMTTASEVYTAKIIADR